MNVQSGPETNAGTRAASVAASRAVTPGAASSTGSVGDRKQSTNVPQGLPPGSVAAVEAEFGLDPFSIALTGIERLEVVETEEAAEDNDEEEERSAEQRLAFSSDAERDEYVSRLRLTLAQKRSSMEKTIDILRAGARHLSGGEDGNGLADGETLEAASSSTASAARQRWAALREAQSNGWKLTPGRPSRSQWSSGQRADEGEQDAWIGFAVPEARSMYARRALAFMQRAGSDDQGETVVNDAAGSDKECKPKDTSKLVFASRVRKTLHASIISLSGSNGQQRRKAVASWSPCAVESDEAKREDSIDAELQAAQRELIDLEIFDDLAAEARFLASQGILKCRSADESVCMQLSSGSEELELVFELQSDQREDGEGGPHEQREEATTTPSPLISLVQCFARLSLVKRYSQRAHAAAAERKQAESKSKIGGAVQSANNESKTSATGASTSVPATSAVTKSASTTATNKKAKLDLWGHAPCLMPLIGLLHYLSFVSSVRHVVEDVLAGYRSGESRIAASSSKSGVELKFDVNAAQSITNASTWLTSLVDFKEGPNHVAQNQKTESSLSARAAAAIQSLSGTASVIASKLPPGQAAAADETTSQPETVVLAHLTMSYPSNLTVQLPWRRTLSGDLGITMHEVDIDSGEDSDAYSGSTDLRGMLVAEVAGMLTRAKS